jgi:ribosomal protein L37AE/L43A
MTSPRSDQPSRFVYQCPACGAHRVNRKRGGCPACGVRLYFAGEWIDPVEGGWLWIKREQRWIDVTGQEFAELSRWADR